MAEAWDGNEDIGCHVGDVYHEKLHLEPIYDSFVCPLTKQVMQDPVTLETEQTFERAAVEKWFRECRDSGKKPICPITLKELTSTDLKPSIALRKTIEEWNKRNEIAQLDIAHKSLSPGSSETDAIQALNYIQDICQRSRSHKHVIRDAELIPMIADMLKSSSRITRCKALETLRMVAEGDTDNKEAIAAGDTIRTIVKILSHGLSQEKEEAVSLLYELSESESLCERIGAVNGSILILVGMVSSKSENVLTVQRAESTLLNLEKIEKNVRQMAENGRLQPLLRLLLEGSPEKQVSMASYLGELVLSNDVKVLVAETAGSPLVDVMQSSSLQAREAALKALNQISSHETSAKILIQAGILPPLIRDLFAVGSCNLPTKLKEVSATILANLVASDVDFESISLDHRHQTLVSESIVHNLLHLISNTGPAIGCKLLQVLVGLTSSHMTVSSIVSAIRSSGAIISLIQFIEAPQRELRVASVKLLHNISPYMSQELADAFLGTAGQLSSLIRIISENNGVLEEQAAAAGLLAELPESDLALTRRLLEDNAFDIIIKKVSRIRQGETRSNRFVNPYLAGLVRVLTRLTYALENEPDTIRLCQEHNLGVLFTDMLQNNGLDKVQEVSAMALENLSRQSKRLTRILEIHGPGFCCTVFPCFSNRPEITGLCKVHGGICSMRESFCLVEGKAVEKLVACLDHENEKVVEAALAAICTLLDDEQDIEAGVQLLYEADGINPILDVLTANRTEVLRHRAVWAVERILRIDEIAYHVSGDQSIGTALVDAFRHADYRTKLLAEKALKHIDKLPNFSGIFQMVG